MTDEHESSFLLELAPGVRVAAAGLRMQYARAGGPGGQNVNKLNTKALLRVELSAIHGLSVAAMRRLVILAGSSATARGEILLVCSIHRSQERNRKEALEKLRELIVAARVEPKIRRPTRATSGSRRRRLDGKRRRSEIKKQRGAGESRE
jgi:ribosome-associated protein